MLVNVLITFNSLSVANVCALTFRLVTTHNRSRLKSTRDEHPLNYSWPLSIKRPDCSIEMLTLYLCKSMPSAQRNGATQLTEAVRLHVKSAVLRPKQMVGPLSQ